MRQEKMNKLMTVLISIGFLVFVPHLIASNNVFISNQCTAVNRNSSCLTLKDCLSDVTMCFRNNHILQLQDGVHAVPERSEAPYLIENVHNLTIKGMNTSLIDCSRQASFAFLNISQLTISDISFMNCGYDLTDKVLNVTEKHILLPIILNPRQNVGLFMVNINNLIFTRVSVNKSLGYGIIGINILGESLVRNCNVLQSNWHIIDNSQSQKLDCSKNENKATCSGGNAVLIYTDLAAETSGNTNTSLTIINTNISQGCNLFRPKRSNAYDPKSKKILITGAGISLLLFQQHYTVTFVYRDSYSIGNLGYNGANIHMKIFSFAMSSTIVLKNVASILGNAVLYSDLYETSKGGGLLYEYGINLNSSLINVRNTNTLLYNVIFQSVNFISNRAIKGGGSYINLHFSPTNNYQVSHLLVFENCSYEGNLGLYGAGLYINKLQRYEQDFENKFEMSNILNISIKNTNFVLQKDSYYNLDHLNAGSGVIFLSGLTGDLTLQNVTITRSKGCSGLMLVNSAIICDGVEIRDNVNYVNGGGSILIGQSCFFLVPHSIMTIMGNAVTSIGTHGGGLYIPSHKPYTYQKLCFFQVLPRYKVGKNIHNITEYNATISIINNTAHEGSDIYGGDLENCLMLYWDVNSLEAYKMFVRTTENNDSSKVTSYAQEICFCSDDGKYDCANQTKNVSAYPGQAFNVSAIPVGQLNGTTSSESIIATNSTLHKKDISILPEYGSYQSLNKLCGNLTYAVHFNVPMSENNCYKNINLMIEGMVESYYWKTVSIYIEKCPAFFILNKKKGICECMKILKQYSIKCEEKNNVIIRPKEYYIGYHDNCTYVYRYCPVHKCSQYQMKITSNQKQDDQCVFHHTGLLCSECQKGYSHEFGTRKCKKCTDAYLTLVLLFAVMGVVLVWGLSFFNLTVSTGMINGLILYANIIKANRDLFYPTLSKSSILPLMIAWINLDFGFQSCFYDGMNEYHKTLLQFVFPVYLWVLSLMAIYLTRRFRSVGRLLGKHCTSALATVLLLSFTKLLNNISKVFAPILVGKECSDGKIQHVIKWWADATIPYFGTDHIILMALASIFVICFIIPYTLLVTASPFLQRLNNCRMFRWVAKWKPFLDAYEGPYNKHWRFWTGFLLLVRVGLMIIFALNIYGFASMQFYVIVITSAALVFLITNGSGIYSNKILNYLEVLPVANLGLFALTGLYLNTWSDLKMDVYISKIMLSAYCTQVLLTIVYQVVSVILHTCGIAHNVKDLVTRLAFAVKGQLRPKTMSWWVNKRSQSHSNIERLNVMTNDCLSEDEGDSWSKPVPDYREPLLNDNFSRFK